MLGRGGQAVGAAGVGLSVGQSVDRQVQPLLRKYVATERRLSALKSHHIRHWLHSLTTHASEVIRLPLSLARAVSPLGVCACARAACASASFTPREAASSRSRDAPRAMVRQRE